MIKIKVMHIVECAGGVDRYIYMLLKNMNQDKFEHILVCSKNYSADNYSTITNNVIQIDLHHEISVIKDIIAIIKIRNIIKQNRPDIVYCHSSKAGGVARIANINLQTPIIYNPHGWAFNIKCSWIKRLTYISIERLLSLFTTHIVAISNHEKTSAIKHHIASNSKVQVIMNGIDLEYIDKQTMTSNITRCSLNIPDNAYLIGMVGRISKQKATDTFVLSALAILKRIPNAFFIIVGGGDEQQHIENLINKNRLSDRFVITQWVENPLSYIKLFDQAVLFSRWEGFGLVLAEYMKMQKPIVATRVGGIVDLINDNENGLLVDIDNIEQIETAIYRIYKDSELKEKFISNGLKLVTEKFNIRRVATEHEELIVNICKNGEVLYLNNYLLAAPDERRAS